jgi:hypothetical protein
MFHTGAAALKGNPCSLGRPSASFFKYAHNNKTHWVCFLAGLFFVWNFGREKDFSRRLNTSFFPHFLMPHGI